MRLIDADALERAIKTECNPYGRPTIDFESGIKVLKIIDNAPTVELRPKGKWIECNPLVEDKYMIDGNEYFKCSECYCCARKKHSFCPDCGSDMRSDMRGDS